PGPARRAGHPERARLSQEANRDAESVPGADPVNAGQRRAGLRARAGTRRHWATGQRAAGHHHVRGLIVSAVETRGITECMAGYLAGHPSRKYVFVGGEGGVGKTVMAGATAVWAADQGRRTLLASTNPVQSPPGLLGQNVFGKHTTVTGVPNLVALEIDTRDAIERSKRDIQDKIQWFLKFAEISTKADEFVESATMNPAFEESAMFENMIDLMFNDEYDTYVFDTAPTANARRLLGMSKVYSLWVNKMVKSREEAQGLRQLLSFTKKKEADPLMDYLVDFQARAVATLFGTELRGVDTLRRLASAMFG